MAGVSSAGGRWAFRLAPYDIRTCLDFAPTGGRLVKQLLTKTGHELWLELNGHPATPIRPERTPHQVLARGGSLMGNVEDPTVLWARCVRHTERLIEELHFHCVRTDALGVSLAWKDGASTAGLCKLPGSSDRFDELLDRTRNPPPRHVPRPARRNVRLELAARRSRKSIPQYSAVGCGNSTRTSNSTQRIPLYATAGR
ncbi:Nucleotidyltransferase/DNA polymerase involved in DNA repair OS=Singulisphaera acidiphila (strain ATCC BAA-1392 / DSM 18658 / VKM B-2454 / MOB10) GN=Sinac_0546 PE=4 SV=1 [Gemmataceae bacterium]|nr:Nucleotidyltransferase/DNA polymerase involved in DNA repair OS=Singulisphaera acidiphila (strain ATCC BAA-1392 / DSM 18658 / VKM B-2454 / MOB10) GN=Sinac_0546 PE=4 SV=1 [Gemmataceae bacterium]VTU00869.1 Nucleotidyltransferase/DNA polymerase involved in DNA repair OS=Singulisphaera acidiphila (strain ATCC BAA-1392 / DSM 18658 / VKM B-2454 / MOB10) GN=Sinac_0546 PE=4 SV=1 [Gemmataceae bacterium]